MRRIYLSALFIMCGLFIISVVSADFARAQLVASEFSTISQTVDGTVMTIEYSRPSRRERDPLFGGVMAYGEIITPGANMATTLEFSKNVKIDGHPVPAGKYSVWIAFEDGEWEFLLDETWQRFHGPHLVREEAEIGISVTPKEAHMEMETLTFHFPAVRADGAKLRMHWGTTMIEMDVEVEPTPLVNIAAEAAPHYVGTYNVDVVKIPPYTMFEGEMEIELTYDNGFLHSIMNIGPYTDPHDFAFYPKAAQVFFPVLLVEGVAAQSFEGGVLFEFEMDNSGHAKSFQARLGADDTLWLTGTRAN